MNRRDFLAMGALSATSLLSSCKSRTRAADGVRRIDRLGLQLYTVRDLMHEDVARTLADVAAIGYDEVEFAGYYGHEAAAIKTMLLNEELAAPAAHVDLIDLLESLPSVLEAATVIGHDYIVLPWLDNHERMTLDDYRRLADRCNIIGEDCRTAGLQFVYHHHDFELTPIDEQRPLDILLNGTDTELMKLEIDFFWSVQSGVDPTDLLRENKGRVKMCHIKDMSITGEMVDPGDGTIDFAELFAFSESAGIEHYFVEHDETISPLATARAGFDHVTSLTFRPTDL